MLIILNQGNRTMKVHERDAERLLKEGWSQPGANQESPAPQESGATPIDSGLIVVKPPKKKTAKSAEIATEAASEDLGNDISKGE